MNLYASKNIASKYIKQSRENYREMDKSIIRIQSFKANTDRLSRPKVSKAIVSL